MSMGEAKVFFNAASFPYWNKVCGFLHSVPEHIRANPPNPRRGAGLTPDHSRGRSTDPWPTCEAPPFPILVNPPGLHHARVNADLRRGPSYGLLDAGPAEAAGRR